MRAFASEHQAGAARGLSMTMPNDLSRADTAAMPVAVAASALRNAASEQLDDVAIKRKYDPIEPLSHQPEHFVRLSSGPSHRRGQGRSMERHW